MSAALLIVFSLLTVALIWAIWYFPINSAGKSLGRGGIALILPLAVVAMLLGLFLSPYIMPVLGLTSQDIQAKIDPPDPSKDKIDWAAKDRLLSFPDPQDKSLKWMIQAEGQGPTVVLNNKYVVPPSSSYVLVYFQRDKPIPSASGAIIVATNR